MKSQKLRSPITWFGGKGLLKAKILPLFPAHTYYVEVFGGGASLLFAKTPARHEVYNDLDDGLTNFFRVLADPELFGAFYHFVVFTPYSRNSYNECLNTWREESNPALKAYKWFVVARMSFSGLFGGSWGSSVGSISGDMPETCASWISIIKILPELHERIKTVQIENSSWEKILARYRKPGTLLYLDPPYVPETRKSGSYAHELTTGDHHNLVAACLNYPEMIVLSGYNSAVYAPLEAAGWSRTDFHTHCFVSGRTSTTKNTQKNQKRTESVWRNPAAIANFSNSQKINFS